MSNEWDAFGSDDDDDASPDDDAHLVAASTLVQQVVLDFVHKDPGIPLSRRHLGISLMQEDWKVALMDAFAHKDIVPLVMEELPHGEEALFLDAIIVTPSTIRNPMMKRLVYGGKLYVLVHKMEDLSTLLDDFKSSEFIESQGATVYENNTIKIQAHDKHTIEPHAASCPWLPTVNLTQEQFLLQKATVALSAHEIKTRSLSERSIQQAVTSLQKNGYCCIRQLLDPNLAQQWGLNALETTHQAADLLKKRFGVDIYHPQASSHEPQSYRELSMREDLRLDIRHGRPMESFRLEQEGPKGNEPVVLQGTQACLEPPPSSSGQAGFLRQNKSLLEIIRRVANPKDDRLSPGNIGRYNFEGSGPDGSFQDLRISPVGAIVSLPGAAEQAIHADTPHLFEHLANPSLPAHYINAFAPGSEWNAQVGGTAFVHGSHELAFTAEHYAGETADTADDLYPYLVRPALTLGDVVLFDCRILHFGLANASKSLERPILYMNTTQAWFHDPKNWDNNQRIFESEQHGAS